MSTQPASPGPVPVSREKQHAVKKQKPRPKAKTGQLEQSKPTRTLPTNRLTVAKQLDILRAYAAASGKGSRAATINEAAKIVKMAPTTVSMANAFFASIGLLKRSDKGSYLPSSEVVQFLKQYEWDRNTASHKLGPRLRETWFAEILLPRISFDDVDEKVAINLLGEAANAGPEYERELRTIIDLMVAGGILQRDGGLIKKSTPADPGMQPRTDEQSSIDAGTNRSTQVNTSFSGQSPAGGVDFNVTVHVDMKDFGNWLPDRISSFFGGIAQVLAAKANVEKEGVI